MDVAKWTVPIKPLPASLSRATTFINDRLSDQTKCSKWEVICCPVAVLYLYALRSYFTTLES